MGTTKKKSRVQLDGDLERLERALSLEVKQTLPGHFLSGDMLDSIKKVDLTNPERPHCSCPDFTFKKRWCKHILSAKLSVLDPHLRGGLADLVSALRNALQDPGTS
jgi:hypothetical protein